MSLIWPMTSEGEYLPQAYNGCSCSCHRHAGVMHVAPCCYPYDRSKTTFKDVDAMTGAEAIASVETPEETEEFARIAREASLKGTGHVGS